MAFSTPNSFQDKDNNVFSDEQFSIPFHSTLNEDTQTHLVKDYRDIFALGQFAWVSGNAWVYNFCKDVCSQLTRGRALSEKQRECFAKNLSRVLEPEVSRPSRFRR